MGYSEQITRVIDKMKSIQKLKLKNDRYMACFIDFKNAFNSSPHTIIIDAL